MIFVTRYSVVGDRVSQPGVFALGLRSVLLCDRPTLVRPLAGAASGVAGRGCRWSEAHKPLRGWPHFPVAALGGGWLRTLCGLCHSPL